MSEAGWTALRIDARDNVAVALRDHREGEVIAVRAGGAVERLVALDPVPLGHKVALCPIAAGAPVLRYGNPIGTARRDIPAGAHVHVHNLASARAVARP